MPSVSSQTTRHVDQEKWDEMADYGFVRYMQEYPKRFRRRVGRGIPEMYRWQVWKLVVGFDEQEVPGDYKELSRTENPWTGAIEMDVSRTFTDNKSFDDGKQQRLLRVLNAYAAHRPRVGYCQGMNYVAGLLILISDSEEEVFRMFMCLMEGHGLAGFYTGELPLLRQYIRACDILLMEMVPDLRRHFKAEDIDPAVYLHQWFLTLFIYTFPFPMVMIIWDMIVYEGLPFVLKLAIAILQVLKDSLLGMKFEDIIDFFKKLKRSTDDHHVSVSLDAYRLGQLLIKHTESVNIPEDVQNLIKSPMALEEFVSDVPPADVPSAEAPPEAGEEDDEEEQEAGWYAEFKRMVGVPNSSPKKVGRTPNPWSRAISDSDNLLQSGGFSSGILGSRSASSSSQLLPPSGSHGDPTHP